MSRTGDQAFIKDLNKSIVLKLLRTEGPISRVDLARRSGLNKATISAIMDELIQNQYVNEAGHGESQVGRRPVLLEFNPTVGRVVGVEIGTSDFQVHVFDLAANLLSSHHETFTDIHDSDVSILQLEELLKRVMNELPGTPVGLVGIGIGVPGLVDAQQGIILNAPNLGWHDVHLKERLEQTLQTEIFVDNEANAGAMGESLFGIGKGMSNLVYVSVGTGIGTGIILNGTLIRGESGVAGEFGHMTIEREGRHCSCGSQGCLEMYASEKGLIEEYHRLTGQIAPLAEIFEALAAGNSSAARALETTGHSLGTGIASLVNALSPAQVIISTHLKRPYEQMFIEFVRKTMLDRSFVAKYANTRVISSTLGTESSSIGAASLVLHEWFAGPR